MDIIVKISVVAGDYDPDPEQARRWLAEEIRYSTRLTVTGYEQPDEPTGDFEVTAISFDSD